MSLDTTPASHLGRLLDTLKAAEDIRYDSPAFSRSVYSQCYLLARTSCRCRLISASLVAELVKEVRLSSTACPPLPVTVHAILDIIRPTFLPARMPALLHLIAHLETTRLYLCKTLRIITDPSNPDSELLSSAEKERLGLVCMPSALQSHRKTYRSVVNMGSLIVRFS